MHSLIKGTPTRKLSHDTPAAVSPTRQSADNYRHNMLIFMKNIEQEMSTVIDRYQSQIKDLKKQIVSLKKQLSQYQGAKNHHHKFRPASLDTHQKIQEKYPPINLGERAGQFEFQNLSQVLSPIKKRVEIPVLKFGSTNSNFIDGLPLKSLFAISDPMASTKRQIKLAAREQSKPYKFQLDHSFEDLRVSKFEKQSNKSRQKQQNLVNSLELGRSNLDQNTQRMFMLLGKSKEANPQTHEVEQEIEYKAKKKHGDSNTSLNSICDSLNNSFHGKKAAAKNKAKRKQQQKTKQSDNKKQLQQQKMLKEQGVKNLLKTMRKNVREQQQPEIIKNSKLLITGNKSKAAVSSSKVMINPVPVDLNKKSQASKEIKAAQSNIIFSNNSTKQPQSILKNSSNILTRSISNISAISFHESGGDQ